MIANGNLKKNRVIPVNLRQNIPPELTEDEQSLIAGTFPLRRRGQNGEPPRRTARVSRTSVTSAIESLGRAKIGFTRWRNAALEETNNERENSFVGLQRPRSRMKLGIPNKISIHRMNAAQLSDLDDLVEDSIDGVPGREMRKKTDEAVSSPSRALLYYFAKLASNSNEQEIIDLEFVGTLIQSGADVNITDRHGQSVMHEAARQWEVQVAKFLIDK
ncbi:uncharacterized protein LOC110238422, partial [Exaiptasia diaphana]|uniref:Uncharacterized protein n=1 Tax=Exaiptasia diaphana TaxID=2652724 RepID=A0A913X6L1_EXADI